MTEDIMVDKDELRLEYLSTQHLVENLNDVFEEPTYGQEANHENIMYVSQEQEQEQHEVVEENRETISTKPLQLTSTSKVSSPVPIQNHKNDNTLDDIRHKWLRLKSVPCDICHKIFLNRSKMLFHRRTHDKNRIRFQCSYNDCDREYSSKQACDLHYRQTHLETGHICPVCQKHFVIRQTLEVHMRYHTGSFPYECECCDKKFAQKGHLTTHMQVKHNNLRYICQQSGCGKVFKNSMSLRNHSFVHVGMPFQCAFCDKGYPQKSKLKVHISLKHKQEFSLDQLESMRKFKDPRIRHSFVRLETEEEEEAEDSIIEFDEEVVREVEVSL